MKDVTQDTYKVQCFPPKPQSGARWTWSCTLDETTLYFVENTSVYAQKFSRQAIELMVIRRLGFEDTPLNREYFFPGGAPTLELMDRLHYALDPPVKEKEKTSSVRV